MFFLRFAQAFVAPLAWSCYFVTHLDRHYCCYVFLLLEVSILFFLLNVLLCSSCLTCCPIPLAWPTTLLLLFNVGAPLAWPITLLLLFNISAPLAWLVTLLLLLDPLPFLPHDVVLLFLLDVIIPFVQCCCSLLNHVPFCFTCDFVVPRSFCLTLLLLLLLFQINIPSPPPL